MCPQNSILASSALPYRTKRTVHTQEGVRILSRCHDQLPWETKARHLTELSARMASSGYNHGFRAAVITSAIKAFQAIQERAERGVRPVHRPDILERVKRAEDKLWKGQTWFRRGGYTTTLFVPPTPGSELAKQLQAVGARECQGRDVKVRVVERAGQSLVSLLQKTDPSPKQPCGDTGCLPCNTGDLGTCRANNVVYSLECTLCDPQAQAAPLQPPDRQRTQVPNPAPVTLDVPPRTLDVPPRNQVPTYIGESGRNMYTRGKERSQLLQKKDSSSAMWKHCAFAHGGDTATPFRMKLLSKHRDPLSHVITEGSGSTTSLLDPA